MLLKRLSFVFLTAALFASLTGCQIQDEDIIAAVKQCYLPGYEKNPMGITLENYFKKQALPTRWGMVAHSEGSDRSDKMLII